eukprot:671803-Amphidinium_carterae.1
MDGRHKCRCSHHALLLQFRTCPMYTILDKRHLSDVCAIDVGDSPTVTNAVLLSLQAIHIVRSHPKGGGGGGNVAKVKNKLYVPRGQQMQVHQDACEQRQQNPNKHT